jgi:hypothetical protein
VLPRLREPGDEPRALAGHGCICMGECRAPEGAAPGLSERAYGGPGGPELHGVLGGPLTIYSVKGRRSPGEAGCNACTALVAHSAADGAGHRASSRRLMTARTAGCC